MDMNVVRRYSHLREKLLRITNNNLDVKLIGTIQICDGSVRSKAKARDVRKKTYARESQPGERIVVDTTGPFPESLIENRYWISIVDDYSRYSWDFFTKTKSQPPEKVEEFFEKIRHQFSISVATTQENTNQNCRRRAKRKMSR